MMSDKKPQRLSKVAREFNVGISTIVDYLAGQGIEIEAKPNSKLNAEVYDVLLSEFQSEKMAKENSRSVGLHKEVRETISIEDTRLHVEEEEEEEPEVKAPKPAVKTIRAEVKEDMKVSVVGKINLEALKKTSKEEPPKPKKVADPKETEKTVIPPVEKPVEKPAEPAVAKEAPKKPAVVAKEAPKKPAETAPAAPDVTEKKPEIPEEKEKPAAIASPVKTKEKELAKEKPDTKSKVPELIKAKVAKLAGPTVVGKIELPAARQQKPVASSANPNTLKKKRKRKRIRKVDVGQEAKKRPDNHANKRGAGNHKKGAAKSAKPEVSEKEIQREIKETLARLSGQGKNKGAKNRRAKREAVSQRIEEEAQRAEAEKSILKVTEFVTVSELSSMMDVGVTEVISVCMSLGLIVNINQRLDAETLKIVAEEFGYSVDFVSAEVQDIVLEEEDDEGTQFERPPIVTVMGHVDHGKTSLLDYIRRENVVAGEAGGITQHIGAYKVSLENDKKITFLDTPGHEAFTAMRARGAQVTDVAIIIIAADDSVMPQTKEAINHAKAASVPMVFAFNKVDRPGANADKIREELSAMNILVEEWGGKYQSQEVSAKTGHGVDELLEKVLLEAELLELKANPKKRAVGTIIESSLDKGRGYVATLLVEAGTMRVGDIILAGQYNGRVKAMHNERGQQISEAGPSTPVSMLGLNGAPSAGDRFNVMEDEKESKSIATKRMQLQREQGIRAQRHMTLDEIGRRLAIGDFQELNVIVKGDVDGSIEALSDSLQKLSTEQIQVNIIHKAVGQITESDVLLATASNAIIIGFQVRPSQSARKLAESEQIDIRLYSIIYQAIEEIKAAMEGMLSPDIEEKITGTAEIRETFKISKVGTVAGCYMLEGTMKRSSQIRIIRNGIVTYTGELGSLKRFKEDVKEVKNGYECGLNINNFNDIKIGDHVEAYEEVEVAKKL